MFFLFWSTCGGIEKPVLTYTIAEERHKFLTTRCLTNDINLTFSDQSLTNRLTAYFLVGRLCRLSFLLLSFFNDASVLLFLSLRPRIVNSIKDTELIFFVYTKKAFKRNNH